MKHTHQSHMTPKKGHQTHISVSKAINKKCSGPRSMNCMRSVLSMRSMHSVRPIRSVRSMRCMRCMRSMHAGLSSAHTLCRQKYHQKRTKHTHIKQANIRTVAYWRETSMHVRKGSRKHDYATAFWRDFDSLL